MENIILTSTALKLMMGCFGIIGIMIASRLFDIWARIDFRKGFDRIETHPQALALYYGCRIIALALIVASALL